MTTPAKAAEAYYQGLLHAQVGGQREVTVRFGRADLVTETHIWEVEAFASWRAGTRQALAYAAQTGLSPALALYGAASRDEVLRVYLRLRDCHTPVALWWWRGTRWDPISSRAACLAVQP